MSRETDRIAADLQKFATELEALIANVQKVAGGRISDHLEEASTGFRSALTAAQRRVGDLKAEFERRVSGTAKAATESVLQSPWRTVATAAATAFLVGFALAHSAAGSGHRHE
jgi:ElaB/YqjD/DUF883 family membrane-anchored ribosome-binding protein